MKKSHINLSLVTLLLGFTTLSAKAQPALPSAATLLPPSATSERLSKELTRVPSPRQPGLYPSVQPQTTAPSTAGAEVKFKLKKLDIEGSTVFTQQQLATFAQPYLNKEISLNDLEAIANSLETQYHKAGYLLTKVVIPPQRITKAGEVKFEIIEGYIDSVSVEGNVGDGVKRRVMKYGDRIEKSKPLRMSVLERYVLLADDLPGVTAKTVLSPSPDHPGASHLTFVLTQAKFDGFINYDNRGTKYLGPNILSANGNYNNLFGTDKIGAQAAASTPFNEMQFGQVLEQHPIGSNGLLLTSLVSYSHTEPGDNLSDFNIYGASSIASFNLSYPVVRSRSKSFYLNATLDGLNANSSMNLIPLNLYLDRIRSARLGATFTETDAHGNTTVDGQFSQGLDILNARLEGTPEEPLSRPDGDATYSKVTADIIRIQQLNNQFSLKLAANGQYGFDPLLLAEQLGFGGILYGRGFDPSQIVGDRGLEDDIELRYDTQPNWKYLKTVQYYGFTDAGILWNIDTNSQPYEQKGTTAGLGARFQIVKHLYGNLEIAKPLMLRGAPPGSANSNEQYYFGILLTS